MGFDSNWGYVLAVVLVAGLCALVGGALILVHCFLVSSTDTRTVASRTDAVANDARLSMFLSRYGTWLCVAMYWLFVFTIAVQRSLLFAHSNLELPCSVFLHLIASERRIAKFSTYSVLVSRCHVVFHNSAFGYSPRVIHSLYAIIAVAFTAFITLDAMMQTGNNEDMDYAANGRHVEKDSQASLKLCVPNIVKILAGASLSFDVFFSLFILVLFVRPLKSLLKQMEQLGGDRPTNPMDIALELLPVKYTTICVIMVLSMIFTYVLMVAIAPIFALLDNVVNIFCLFAMTGYWNPIYWRFCGPLHRCLSHAPCFGERNRENVKAIIAHYRSGGLPHIGTALRGRIKSDSGKSNSLKSNASKGVSTISV